MKAITTIFTVATLAASVIACDGGYYDADTDEFVGAPEETVAESVDELLSFNLMAQGDVCKAGNMRGAGHDLYVEGWGHGKTIVSATEDADAACDAEVKDLIKRQNEKADHANYVCESPHTACTNLSHTDAVSTEKCKVFYMTVRNKNPRVVQGPYHCFNDNDQGAWECPDLPGTWSKGDELQYHTRSFGKVASAANECVPANEDESSSATISEL
jgi:hypothetical protein